MKHLKLPFLGLALVLTAASCRKVDYREDTPASAVTAPVSEAAADWQSVASWESATEESFSVYYTTIEDSRITEEVVDNGLVLAYKKDGASISALPFEQSSGKGSAYWYHQISAGSILFSADSYGANAPGSESQFRYFVITPDQLSGLEASGYSKADLITLSFDEASALFQGK